MIGWAKREWFVVGWFLFSFLLAQLNYKSRNNWWQIVCAVDMSGKGGGQDVDTEAEMDSMDADAPKDKLDIFRHYYV